MLFHVKFVKSASFKTYPLGTHSILVGQPSRIRVINVCMIESPVRIKCLQILLEICKRAEVPYEQRISRLEKMTHGIATRGRPTARQSRPRLRLRGPYYAPVYQRFNIIVNLRMSYG